MIIEDGAGFEEGRTVSLTQGMGWPLEVGRSRKYIVQGLRKDLADTLISAQETHVGHLT